MTDKIIKSEGLNDSEKYLIKLSNKTFLNLWAYPNVYRDVLVNGKKTGKELCDLLVVCGNQVIIFSDKFIKWSEHKDVSVAWSRWFRKAIKKSADQIRGAERWILENPDRIFIDQACTKPLPIKILDSKEIKIHSVCVAMGASKACEKYFMGDAGSFMIFPHIKDDSHFNKELPDFMPFCIGDIDTKGSFIHVMNDVTLDIVMQEMDTITDFTNYLDKKANFIRSGYLGNVAGEEDLLSYYMTNMEDEFNHGFTHPQNTEWKEGENLIIGGGLYEETRNNPSYIRKKQADKISYFLWDGLIETFTKSIIDGTTLVSEGEILDVSKHEIGVRYMAMEPRVLRRMYAEGIDGILKKSHEQDRTFRTMMPNLESKDDRDTAYIIMTLKHPKKELKGGCNQYRSVRLNMLQAYCLKFLMMHPHVRRVVGIAFEPPSTQKDNGFSEDMIYAEQPEKWSKENIKEIDRLAKHFNILQNIKYQNFGVSEYPD